MSGKLSVRDSESAASGRLVSMSGRRIAVNGCKISFARETESGSLKRAILVIAVSGTCRGGWIRVVAVLARTSGTEAERCISARR